MLIGFMGSGKTTAGKRLAAALGRPFLDTDGYIEEREGVSISGIFAEKGEVYFREAEAAAAKALSRRAGKVIATGGGMVKSAEAMEALKASGIVIYLKATPREVLLRTAGDGTRPLLAGPDKLQKITDLLSEREPLYEKYADITVEVTGKTAGAVFRELIGAVERYEKDAGA